MHYALVLPIAGGNCWMHTFEKDISAMWNANTLDQDFNYFYFFRQITITPNALFTINNWPCSRLCFENKDIIKNYLLSMSKFCKQEKKIKFSLKIYALYKRIVRTKKNFLKNNNIENKINKIQKKQFPRRPLIGSTTCACLKRWAPWHQRETLLVTSKRLNRTYLFFSLSLVVCWVSNLAARSVSPTSNFISS